MDYGYYVCSVNGVQKAIKLTNDIKQVDNKGTAIRIYTCIDPHVERRKTPYMSIPVAGTQPTVQIIDSVESNYQARGDARLYNHISSTPDQQPHIIPPHVVWSYGTQAVSGESAEPVRYARILYQLTEFWCNNK